MPLVVVGRCRFTFALPLVAAIAFANVSAGAPPEPLTLTGHTGWVGGVAFSPDGGTLATASSDVTVKFWDVATGKERATLEAHGDAVTSVAFAKDGKSFATASFDGTVKVWNAENRRLVHTFRGHRGAVLTVAFDPNGQFLASGGIDGTVRIWNLESGKEWNGTTNHKSWVNALAYDPDGHRLATVSSDNEVWFRDNWGKEWMIVRPKVAEVRSVAYSPNGKFLAAGTRYGVTKVWDANGDEAASLTGKHAGDVWAVAFGPDGKTLATADGDWNKPSDIVLWDTTTWKERARLKHTNEVLCIAFHPKKPILAAGAWDKTVKVWDLTEEKTPPQPLPQRERGFQTPPSFLGKGVGGLGSSNAFVPKADR